MIAGFPVAEITEKRIAGTERKKSESGNLVVTAWIFLRRSGVVQPAFPVLRKQPINDFVGGTISTDRYKFPISMCIGLAGNPSGIACRLARGGFHRNPRGSQAIKRRADTLATPSTTGSRINNRKKCFVHNSGLRRGSCENPG